jgi:tRNA U34 2-thiouridine synthase MnmA/TrmU
MSLSPDEFHMLHGDAVRESLMTVERHDGAFELLAHCRLCIEVDKQERLFAVVRSTNTNRAYILVQQPDARQWRAISAEDLHLLRQQLDSMTEAARECARGLLAARSSAR